MELVKNQDGFSLVQVLMSIGLMSGIGLGVAQLTLDSSKAVNKMEVDSDLLVVYRSLISVLSNPANCKETFQGLQAANQPDAVEQIKKEVKGVFVNEFPTSTLDPSRAYGARQLKILSYSLSDAAADVDVITKSNTHLVIQFDRGLGKVSTKIVTKKIVLNVQVDGDNKITTCSAIGESGSDIWKYAGNQTDVFFNGGNVGVGTNAPDQFFDVVYNFNGKNNFTAAFIGGDEAGFWNTGAYFVQKDNVGLGSAGTKLFNVVSNGNSKFVVDGTGKVGIGKNNPVKKLDIEFDYSPYTDGIEVRNTNANGGASITLSAGSNSLGFTSWGNSSSGYAHNAIGSRGNRFLLFSTFDPQPIVFHTNWGGVGAPASERVRITASGNVGIGTTAPSEKLHVMGNILSSGTITPSDRRLKKDIRPLTGSLEKITGLNPVSYQMKNKQRRELGIIAQDVQKVFPEAVHKMNNGNLAVSYQSLISPLIGAIKELKKENEILREEIKKLKKQ